MMMLVLENVREGFRGEISKWLLEPHAGVFVGNVSATVRDSIWGKAEAETRENRGAGLMIFSADTEQGFDMRLTGSPSRKIVDMEGIKLVSTIQS